MIQLDEKQWLKLYNRLARDYQHRPSVLLIRDSMRRELGCTVRRHKQWHDTREQALAVGMPEFSGYTKDWICLDFYDASRETWFRLKYSDFLP
jgi:hypothetical protein